MNPLILAFYGSPRRNGNTATLLSKPVHGATEAGAEVTVSAYNRSTSLFTIPPFEKMDKATIRLRTINYSSSNSLALCESKAYDSF